MNHIKRIFFSGLMVLSFSMMMAQNTDVFGNKIPEKKKSVPPIPEGYNKTDNLGRKQGPWEKRYTDGTTLYTATFKNNKPIGEYIRFYPTGKKSLHIIFDVEGTKGKAELFDEEGNLSSKGNYIGTIKDSTWTFYTIKNQVISTEDYTNGIKNGKTIVYYPEGNISEVINWHEDVKHGPWLKFYSNGLPQLETQYVHGVLQGTYNHYHENGKPSIKANYKDDLEDGDWIFYNPDGEINYVLKFDNGKLLNPEIIDSKREAEHQEFLKNKDNFRDPDKMRNDPDQYFRPQ